MDRSTLAAAALLALGLVAAEPARATTMIDPAVRESLSAPSSADRERGLYLLARTLDATVLDDRELMDRAYQQGTPIERAAILRGACDRAPLAGETLGRVHTQRVIEALDSLDVGLRSAAIDCLDRLPADQAATLRLEQLDDVRGRGLPPVLIRAVITSVVRHADPKTAEVLARYASTELRGSSQFSALTAEGAWLVLAMAANGTNVEPMFSDSLKASTASDYALQTRLNGIRAGRGDDAALTALVETANVAVEKFLRRDAVDFILAMPAARRAKAVAGLESRLGDIDGPLRARLVREISREAANADVATEKMLVRVLDDVFPDLRVQAIAGLFDRAAARTLTVDALATARRMAASEMDPLAIAAYRALFAKAEEVTKTPAPTPVPSETPAAAPSPAPSATPAPVPQKTPVK